MSTGSVYREIGSKEELLVSIMRSFSEKVVAGWDAALTSTVHQCPEARRGGMAPDQRARAVP